MWYLLCITLICTQLYAPLGFLLFVFSCRFFSLPKGYYCLYSAFKLLPNLLIKNVIIIQRRKWFILPVRPACLHRGPAHKFLRDLSRYHVKLSHLTIYNSPWCALIPLRLSNTSQISQASSITITLWVNCLFPGQTITLVCCDIKTTSCWKPLTGKSKAWERPDSANESSVGS